MAKKMKKVLALVLALALCAGQLAIPVVGTEADTSSSTVTPIEGGTQTVTTTTDPATGTQTTVTEIVTNDPATGTSFESTSKEVSTSTGGGTQTSESKEWSSTTTQTGSDTQSGNPTVQTDTNKVTTVTGSEDTSQTITHGYNSETVKGSTQGEETTDIVDTTTTTTTTTDVLFSDEDSSRTDEKELSNTSSSTTGEWVEGKVQEGQWKEGDVKEGTPTTIDGSSETSDITATNPGEATIVMTPDGKTVEVEVDVTIDQVLAGVKIPAGAVEIKRDGKVIGYKVVKTTETSTPDPNPTVETVENPGAPTQTPVAPNGYTEGTVTNGNVTTKTEAITDDNGKTIGYRVTTTTTTENTDTNTTESTRDTTTDTFTAQDVFTLPARPQESESKDGNGYVTKTVVEDIIENNQVVGYKSTTTYYSPEGETMRTESNSIFGTTSSSSTQVVKDPETEVETIKTTNTKTEVNEIYTTISTRDVTLLTERTNNITTTTVTEEDIYQLVETEDGLYFLYKGTMQPVVALAGNGNVTLTGLTPTATPSAKNDLASKTSISKPPSIINPGDPGSDQFKYIDYGLISNFRVKKADGENTSEVHLYKLVDVNGNAYYAYCADLDTTAYRNTIYDISNAKDEDYYQNNGNSDAYAHLQAIAINSYWGTSSGTGSMDAIRTLLRKYGYNDVANSITDGEAMTASQAAIWAFGNTSDSKKIDENSPADKNADSTSKKNINTLYKLLISDQLLKDTNNTETDIITENDITGATLDLKGKVTDASGAVSTDASGNELYKADLTFTLAVEQSAFTGNLKVVIKDSNGTILREEQLLTEDSNFIGKALADGTGYSHTIKDLELAEGVKINLNLEGYQNLKKGVYIYTAASGSHTDSQTFIGVSEGKRDVNLQVQLDFTVEDPQLEYVDKSTTQVRNDTRVDKKEDKRTDTREDKKETNKVTEKVVTETNVKVYGTETVTETKKNVTKEKRSWESYWKYLLTTISDEDGGGNNEDKDFHIQDEEVPLAAAPNTGDLSGLYAVISGLSLGGVVLLNRKRKGEKDTK